MAAAATYLGPLSVVFLTVHIALMYGTYWSYFTDEFGVGDIAFTIGAAVVPLLVGFVLSRPYVMSPLSRSLPKQPGRGLASQIGTAQKGSQMLICGPIFAFGAYPVAGVDALTSSVITAVVIIIIILALEWGSVTSSSRPLTRPRHGPDRPPRQRPPRHLPGNQPSRHPACNQR